jgi:hypothetical protein
MIIASLVYSSVRNNENKRNKGQLPLTLYDELIGYYTF